MWDSSLRVIKGEHHISPCPPVASAQHISRQIFSKTKQTCLENVEPESNVNIKKIDRHFFADAFTGSMELDSRGDWI